MLHLGFQSDTDTLPWGPGDEEMSERGNEREREGAKRHLLFSTAPTPAYARH